tara:strand:+ start:1074 stop:1685 length:612 start_codon:yes stop_codon:yes gene_type:complete
MRAEIKEHKLFVGNLHPMVREAHMLKVLAPQGRIVRQEFMWHTYGPRQGTSRGFMFVEYSTRAEAERAVAKLNGFMLMGQPLVVNFCGDHQSQHGSEKSSLRDAGSSSNSTKSIGKVSNIPTDAKIAAIKAKLASMRSRKRGADSGEGPGDEEELKKDGEREVKRRKVEISVNTSKVEENGKSLSDSFAENPDRSSTSPSKSE